MSVLPHPLYGFDDTVGVWVTPEQRALMLPVAGGRGAQTLSAAALWVSDADVLQTEGGSNCCQYGIYDSYHRFTFPAKAALIWSSHRFLKFQFWIYYLFTCASTEKHRTLLLAVYLLKQNLTQNWEAPLYCRAHSILYKRMHVRAEVWSIMANSEIDPVKVPVLWCDGVSQIWCVSTAVWTSGVFHSCSPASPWASHTCRHDFLQVAGFLSWWLH